MGRSRSSTEEQPRPMTPSISTGLGPDVLGSVRQQHPNLSVFHPDDKADSPASTQPVPIEPKGSRRFTLLPKKRDDDPARNRSPSPGPSMSILPKKKSSGNIAASLSRATAPESSRTKSPEPVRRASHDMLRSPADASRSLPLRRPSLDMLRLDTSGPDATGFGSVRSILREPNTPGTGQNVRFFSRDAYKVMTPDQSMDLQSDLPMGIPEESEPPSRQDSLNMLSKSPPRSRPTLNEVFSPIGGVSSDSSMSLDSSNLQPPPPPHVQVADISNPFELSLELNSFPPPGLGFDAPSFNFGDSPQSDDSFERGIRTSTPNVAKDKGKQRAVEQPLEKENVEPSTPNEAIFHAREKSPRLPHMLHGRSKSFTLGQSVFSLDTKSKRSSNSSSVFSQASGNSGHSKNSADSPSPSVGSIRDRSRALSDAVFHSMLSRNSTSSNNSRDLPEYDINDESSSDLVVYSSKPPQTPEPDPFSAHATTYYTPLTNIPVTPPKGSSPRHIRTASKEETILFALQTQLSMQKELCAQYEADLQARDELVDILQRRMSEVEQEDARRKGILRGWKRKVVELERTCRYLEDEVENSRQEGMNRSVLDEASSCAVSAMQEQIGGLQRERIVWQRKEEMYREEVDKWESIVIQRNEELAKLTADLEKREDEQRELRKGILEAQAQIDEVGNMSLGFVPDEQFQRAVQEREEEREAFSMERQEWEAERERWQQEREQLTSERSLMQHEKVQEAEDWEHEKAELLLQLERAQIERSSMKADMEAAKKEVNDDQDELKMLRAELEAQWRHSEVASEKIAALESAKKALEHQRGELQQDINELHSKIDRMEVDYTDAANKCSEVERQLAELWDQHADLENERNELQKRVDDDEVAQLAAELEERDQHIEELVQAHHDEIDQMESSHAMNQANLREELEAQISKAREEHQAEVTRLKEQRDGDKGDFQARWRSEEEKFHQEKLALRSERDRVRQDVARLEDQCAEMETLKSEVAQLRGHVQDLKRDGADKDMHIVSLQKQREKDKGDIEGLNMALDAKQQELQLMKRKEGLKGTAGSTPMRSSSSSVSHQRRPSSISTPHTASRPSSTISDSGRESVMSSVSSNAGSARPRMEKPTAMQTPGDATPTAKNQVLNRSIKMNASAMSTPTPGPNRMASGAGKKPSDAATPAEKLRASASAGPVVTSRIRDLNQRSSAGPRPGSISVGPRSSSVSRPSSLTSSRPSSISSRRTSTSSTEQLLKKAPAAPTSVLESPTESEFESSGGEKENRVAA
ncbi:hypothetical protein CYLTODRAFT_452090 [Cylindrobasidium torrendii FP15055 ss-10]|uniref:Uncharacterized protein n=1 Tax=Cylindrobasidium torrendii FP15055 ss-10 TaxID=1314674 RepID=A0A0D7BHN0_9AGAR|nr:hypothetical protein CYLTODRAFT_452090 [Cylindrobasidium torrendii FP15055 ss-10]